MKKILISKHSTSNITKSKILLDTNILLWVFYERINSSKSYQKLIYPCFVETLLKKDSSNVLYTTIFNILEAFSVIENNEYEIYLAENSLDKKTFSKKDYRLISVEREKIKSMLELFFEQLSTALEITENQISKVDLIEFYTTYTEQYLDSNDFALIKICNEGNFDYLLTDDADFGTYSNECSFTLITANAHAIC